MKILTLALALLCPVAHAHVLLTFAYSVTGPTGVAVTSAPNVTAISNIYTWTSNTACITYAFGTATFSGGIDSGFAVQASAPTVTMCLNLTSGVWQAGITNGPLLQSGTLAGAGLTNAQSIYVGPATALRDAADYFASTTFLPGTQPDLWGIGDL